MSDNKPAKLDLDLINMVQNARMMHDDDAVPSRVPGVYWIEAKHPSPPATPTARSGEFCIETTLATVDRDWQVIKTATEAGELGYKSKVSTAPTDGQPHGEGRLICVRTYDADDTADRERVQQRLTELGFSDVAYRRDSKDTTS